MLQIPIAEVIKKIVKEKGLSEEAIKKKIKDKQNQLTDLVSEEGAAYIIASELGVSVFEDYQKEGRVKIKDVVPGMRSVDVAGRVMRVFDARTFKKGEKVGQVGSFIIADDSDQIRVAIWDERVSWLKTKIKEGGVIGIKDAYSKENNQGGKELHLNIRSQIILDPDIDIELPKPGERIVTSKAISDASSGETIQTIGTVVQIFPPRFYPTCPKCKKSVSKSEDKSTCEEHGKIEPKPSMISSFVLDDGTESIRCSAFGDQANAITGLSSEEVTKLLSLGDQDTIKQKVEDFALARNIRVEARMNYNKEFDRKELGVNRAEVELDARAIAERMITTS